MDLMPRVPECDPVAAPRDRDVIGRAQKIVGVHVRIVATAGRANICPASSDFHVFVFCGKGAKYIVDGIHKIAV